MQAKPLILIIRYLPLAFFTGCAIMQPQPMSTPFNEADFARYATRGNSVISGQAFMKTRGGDVKFGAGNTVTLLPVNPYTTEIRERVTIRGERVGSVDPRFEKYKRTTVADGNGNFEFRDLPPGEYYVSCPITWEVPTGYGLQTTGGTAYGTVKVGPGETAKVIVTR
jgi:hypothetical protein